MVENIFTSFGGTKYYNGLVKCENSNIIIPCLTFFCPAYIIYNISLYQLLSGEYNLTFPPLRGGGERNQKSDIREENSKLIRKRRDKKGREEKNGKKKGGKGRKKEKIKERTEKIS